MVGLICPRLHFLLTLHISTVPGSSTYASSAPVSSARQPPTSSAPTSSAPTSRHTNKLSIDPTESGYESGYGYGHGQEQPARQGQGQSRPAPSAPAPAPAPAGMDGRPMLNTVTSEKSGLTMTWNGEEEHAGQSTTSFTRSLPSPPIQSAPVEPLPERHRDAGMLGRSPSGRLPPAYGEQVD